MRNATLLLTVTFIVGLLVSGSAFADEKLPSSTQAALKKLADPATADSGVGTNTRRHARNKVVSSGPLAVPALVKMVQDSEVLIVRANALIAIVEIASKNPNAAPQAEELFLSLLTSIDFPLRYWAFKGAGEVKSKQAVPRLVERLVVEQEDPAMRMQAVLSLGQIGDTQAVKPLIAALQSESDGSLRAAAADALKLINERSAVDVLASELAKTTDPRVRSACAEALSVVSGCRVATVLQTSDDVQHALDEWRVCWDAKQ